MNQRNNSNTNTNNNNTRSNLDIRVIFAVRTWAGELEIDLSSPSFSSRATLGALCLTHYGRIPTTSEWSWLAAVRPVGV